MYRPTLQNMGLPSDDFAELIKKGIPHSDETPFDDGFGYDMIPTVVATVPVAAGADSIVLPSNAITDAIQPGNFFSVDDWPYQITQRFVSGGNITFYFEPILRRAIAAGDQIKFEATALMVFVEDLEGRMPLDMGKRGETDINLLEWVDR